MALLIADECISCHACLPACPNNAIFEKRGDAEAQGYHVGEGQGLDNIVYVITHERCTECVGHFDEPQCAAACPIGGCCIPDPGRPESKELLLERAERLNPRKKIHHDKVWQGVTG